MREYFLEIGDLALKYLNGFLTRPIFSHLYSRFGPFYFKRQFGLGDGPRSFIDSVVDYYLFVSSYGAWPLEIAEVTENRVVVYLDKCTVKCHNNLKLCLALTSMEPSLSKKPWFGARVAYTERIPAGNERCKLVMEQKEVGH
jgi:hypothetical protein